MKSVDTAKQWLNRLRATPRSGAAGELPGTAPLQTAIQLMKTGDLLGATKAIQQGIGRLSAVGGGPSVAAERSFEQLDEGTFSDFKRPVRPNAGAKQRTPGNGGQFQEASYANPAGSRRYKLFIPSAYCGQALPLVVMLHGCKQSPDDFALGTRMNELAESQQCFVAYPTQSKTANASGCWNWFNAFDQRRGYGEPAVIAGLTRELVKKYGLDPSRVYVAGLSAGGAMAVVMGRTYPDLYAAVGVHSGLPYASAHDVATAFAAMKGTAPAGRAARPVLAVMPAIVFHGDSDKTVHHGNGERVTAECAPQPFSAASGKPIAAVEQTEEQRGAVAGGYAYTRRLFRSAGGKVIVEQWVVHGAGHAWFGGNPRGSYTDPKGPDASREMMRFFTAHTLDKQHHPQHA